MGAEALLINIDCGRKAPVRAGQRAFSDELLRLCEYLVDHSVHWSGIALPKSSAVVSHL
jgi:hypothetical protein